MKIEELPTVQRILNRIQDIEGLPNRFVKEIPVQNRLESFDSILKTVGEKSVSNPQMGSQKRNSGDDRENTLAEIIRRESEKNHLDPFLVQSVIKAESGFKADAISPKGAIGLMQLMPSTANLLGVDDPSDPAENVAGGTKFLSDLLNKYKNLDHALAAYNAGPKAVDHYGGIPPFKETKKYVEKVKKFYKDFSE
ncbi:MULTISPECIES: lytic transglycosylase domain-containing protein [Leptospira]|uniref:Lytic transglycosylase n=4 Tax=Leptospira santarosai TaxID=28183 RepID=A0AB73N8T9_9LEPT|nr:MULTISPECIES: lytic transglycosylase domain-containing protein [Leptospira]EMO56325.1 transglycosylase SLT domain protein [Leptospira santarosai str. CBC1416]ASV13583.1 lytic transglycosylase [Leptospira santarosai]AVV51951.1 Lytic transglycosylase [Leptospira santarosai]AVV81213.1 Lytic transglycosylase [Leptospira santarosai]EKO35658.1 transglycosylase SLT domain protein [Leptospira santarosai str. MOR084]